VNTLRLLGVQVRGVILNKLYISYMTDEVKQIMQRAFSHAGVELLGMVPRLNVMGRGMIPEIEIRYEDFGAEAIDAAERYINLDMLEKIAAPPDVKKVDYSEVTAKFKKLLTDYPFNAANVLDKY
jgi:cobyrinic acid a,c-diamide synthase